MRLLSSARIVTVATALLAGCSGTMSGPTPPAANTSGTPPLSHPHAKPHWRFPASVIPGLNGAAPRAGDAIARIAKPHGNLGGIYVSQFLGNSILAYTHKNTPNNPPTCTTGPVSDPNGIAVDGKGNLIDPDGGSRTVIIFAGPGMCGAKIGSFSDPFGQPTDAASADAVNGPIAVANIYGPSAYSAAGSIAMCTLSGGCTTNLQNPAMYEVAGVAMDNSGNCWADAQNASGFATLTYFAGLG